MGDARGVGIASEGVGDQNRVRAGGVQMTPGLIGDFDRGKGGSAFECDAVELSQLGFNNQDETS